MWTENKSYIRKVYTEWERFITTGNPTGLLVRPEILDSWVRSYNYGVSTTQWRAPTILNLEELNQERIKNKEILEAARPLMKEIGHILDGTGQLLVLCNTEATIIDTMGDRDAHRNAINVNLCPGASLAEPHNGTTGAALVASRHQPVTILASEHYVMGPKEWGCTAAPIKDPITQKMTGILCLTGKYMFVNTHSIGLIRTATRQIEGCINEQYLRRLNHLLSTYNEIILHQRADLIMAVDIYGQVVDASNHYHQLLVGQPQPQNLNPDLKQIIDQLLVNPLNQNKEYNIEVTNKGRQTLTYTPVFMNHTLCGIIIMIYENKRYARNRSLETDAQIIKSSNDQYNSPESNAFKNLVGNSHAFNKTIELAKCAALSDVTVVLQGETGVGKEEFARGIHHCSKRKKGPFIAVNCGAIPKELIASELFGYEPGAFTGALPRGKIGKFEAANHGTLFLDEIGELSIDAQTYLLRVLQEKEIVRVGGNKNKPIDVRVIAATNRDLKQLIREDCFREDLYYRLCIVEIHIPPLRERPEDIPLLIDHFLSKSGIHGITLKESILQSLIDYQWPGNVRELMNVIQRSVVLGQNLNSTILEYINQQKKDTYVTNEKESIQYDLITHRLLSNGGNVTKTARELGVARSTIYRHLKKKKVHVKRSLIPNT